MTYQIHIGTSGWIYNHWQGRFYPEEIPKSEWFTHYDQSFDTVEINNTFYKQPENDTFDRWRDQAPEGFLYAVKANRFLTHMRKLRCPEEPLERFYSGARRLREHLGPILFQLPPRWKKNLSRLREFAQLLPAGLMHVIEFRDPDWLSEDTFELLSEYNLSLGVHDLLPNHPRLITGHIIYVRFHGWGQKYEGKYPSRELQLWADWIGEMAQNREVFVYFNNDAFAHAVQDAKELLEMLAQPSQS